MLNKQISFDFEILIKFHFQGIVNIPARLTFGFLADSGKITAVNLNTLCIMVAIIAMGCYGFLKDFVTQCIFSVVFAIGIGLGKIHLLFEANFAFSSKC